MSAFLQGIVGGASSVQAFGQQQYANKMAKMQFDESIRQYDQNYELAQKNYNIDAAQNARAEKAAPGQLEGTRLTNVKSQQDVDKADLTKLYQDNDRWIGNAQNQGWLGTEDYSSLDIDNSTKLITKGGQVADSFILGMAQRDKDLPEGFVLDTVDRSTGKIIISGKYKDGRAGVLTVDGKISDDAEVVGLEPRQLAQLMSDEYVMNIAGNSNMGSTSALVQMNLAKGMAQADAEVLAKRQKSFATLQTQVVGEIDKAAEDPSTGEGTNVGLKRAFRGALASAETAEAKLSILIEQATAMGIEIPEILVQPVAEENIETEPEATPEAAPEELRRPAGRTASNMQGALIGAEELNKLNKSSLDQFNVDLKKTPDQRRAEAEPPKAGGLSSIPNQSEAARAAATALEEGVFSQIEGMDAEQIKAYIDNGGFTPTQEDGEKITTVLKEAGVETMADVDMLPTQAQINTRVWLMMISPDVQTRDRLGKEIANLQSGSGRSDASLAEVQKLGIDQQNANSKSITANTGVSNAQTARLNYKNARDKYSMDLEKMDFDQGKQTGEFITTNMQALEKGLYELDDKGNPTKNLKFDEKNLRKAVSSSTGALTQLRRKLDSASPQNRPALRGAVNSVYSMTIQAMAASEEYGTLGEFLPDGSIDFLDGHDKFLARVFVAERGTDGKPSRFGIRSLSSLTQVEETVSASVLKNIFGNQGYADFRQQIAERKNIQDTKINQTGLGK